MKTITNLSPIVKQLLTGIACIGLVLLIGTLGYVYLEEWSWSDSFFMSVITVTTVGYGEIKPLTEVGRVFTVVLILAGFGIVAMMATQTAQFVLEGDLRDLMWKRRMKIGIDKLSGHYIVCGYGRVGQVVCNLLEQQGIQFVVAENDPEMTALAKERKLLVVSGDALSDEALLEAGIARAAGVISVLNHDSDNLLVSLSARELNHNLHIVARGETADIEPKLLRAGADTVISPYKISGEHITDQLLIRRGQKMTRCRQCSGTDVAGYQLHAVQIQEKAGKTVGEMVQIAGAVSAAALDRKESGELLSQPESSLVLEAGDQLVLLLKKGALDYTVENRPAAEEPEEEKPLRVVLADDHVALLRIFAKKLRSLGHEVMDVPDGTQALEKIKSDKPDLAILDAMMPGMSGDDVCRAVKKDPELKSIRVVLFSNRDISELKRMGDEAGADGVVAKSASSNELVEMIERVMQA